MLQSGSALGVMLDAVGTLMSISDEFLVIEVQLSCARRRQKQ